MVKIVTNLDDETKEFMIPENWDEVTVGQFTQLFDINREALNQYEISVKMINIFSDIPEDLIFMMPVADFEKIAQVLEFTLTDIQGDLADSIELEGETYFLKKDFESLTMGEVISIETLINSADGNLFKVMDKLLCLFLRKKKENGKLETFKTDFMERADLFKKAPIGKIYNIFSFFSDGVSSSGTSMKESLPKV